MLVPYYQSTRRQISEEHILSLDEFKYNDFFLYWRFREFLYGLLPPKLNFWCEFLFRAPLKEVWHFFCLRGTCNTLFHVFQHSRLRMASRLKKFGWYIVAFCSVRGYTVLKCLSNCRIWRRLCQCVNNTVTQNLSEDFISLFAMNILGVSSFKCPTSFWI